MTCTITYDSPLGKILVAANESGICGLWFENAKYYAATLAPDSIFRTTPLLREAARWLDLYFAGEKPGFTPQLAPEGSDFRRRVWNILLSVPYGQTTTYKAIAERIARESGQARMSAQAVGGAVGHNPISIIIPCHRVVGSNGSLTGYAGGIERKIRLLELEGASVSDHTHI